MWNRAEKRKVVGNSAPMEKNIKLYLAKHPDCEPYTGQDSHLSAVEKRALIDAQKRVQIWNKTKQKRIVGNAAPAEKGLPAFLLKHLDCEVYSGQDRYVQGPGDPAPLVLHIGSETKQAFPGQHLTLLTGGNVGAMGELNRVGGEGGDAATGSMPEQSEVTSPSTMSLLITIYGRITLDSTPF